MGIAKRLAFLTVLALLCACSGGGSGGAGLSLASQKGPNTLTRTQTVRISFVVPASLGRMTMGSPHLRLPQFVTAHALGVIAVQLCSQTETSPGNGVTSCRNGSIFDTVYDVTNPAVCPSYAPNTTFPCTINFPAAASSGSQFELDIYNQLPVGGTNGVGGVIPAGALTGSHGSGNGAITDGACNSGAAGNGACILGAGLSDPDQAVPLNPAQPSIQISQIEGFIQQYSLPNNATFSGGPIFFTSDIGPGIGQPGTGIPGTPPIGPGPIGAVLFDANSGGNPAENITQSGSCVQDQGNELGNAFTTAADEAPGTAPGQGADQAPANVGGPSYHRDNGAVLNTATGNGNINFNGLTLVAGEVPGPNLSIVKYQPCLVGQTSGTLPAGGIPVPLGFVNTAPINFPGDMVYIWYDGTGNTPAYPSQTGNWGPLSAGGSGASATTFKPYNEQIAALSGSYQSYEFLGGTNCVAGSAAPCGTLGYGTSNSHFMPNVQGNVTLDPLWGEVGNLQPGCTPASCTTPFLTNIGPNPFITQNPAGGAQTPVVNMQGTGSTAQVVALQHFLPTNSPGYSASVPANCAGVVTLTAGPPISASAALFFGAAGIPGGGALWTFTGVFSNTPGQVCTVVFSDGFNTFQMIFTNTGKQNPIPTPAPTPSPSPPPYGGPTAPAAPPII